MTRTGPTPLIALGGAGLVIGYLLEVWAASGGRPLMIPPVTLPLTLVVVAGVVLAFAIPIRRAVTGNSTRMIDPFRATRVVSLAKASSLVGALLAGFGAGILIFLITRPVLPGVASMWLAALSAAGAAVLLVAGLVAEHLCRLPKDDDDDAAGATSST